MRVQPRASRTEVAGEYGDALRVRVAAPPVEGEANRELAKWLAKQIGVAPSQVRVVKGGTGRTKVVEIDTTDEAAVLRALGQV